MVSVLGEPQVRAIEMGSVALRSGRQSVARALRQRAVREFGRHALSMRHTFQMFACRLRPVTVCACQP
jgi:hypothetical protein